MTPFDLQAVDRPLSERARTREGLLESCDDEGRLHASRRGELAMLVGMLESRLA